MTDTLINRGPDSYGIYINRDMEREREIEPDTIKNRRPKNTTKKKHKE